MGQEIADSHFSAEDFACFRERLAGETALLAEWIEGGLFSVAEPVGGFELEAWLVDRETRPAPVNVALLERIDSPFVVPELSLFNLELNGNPRPLRGDALSRLADELDGTWRHCMEAADTLGVRLAMIGILPTVRQEDLNIGNMSPLQRYRALDEQLARIRNGSPLEMAFSGREELAFRHHDVMLEAATTSFQIHFKVGAADAVRCYNASKILAAPMVALSANSPYLFGRDLWDETRIPLFEQAVAVGDSDLTKRVSFGIRYIESSIMECFQANLDRYQVLLPRLMEQPPERFAHLRLHNGTIWRWNRPLVGVDEMGRVHLRIEHRVVPAGPTIQDSIANAAFYFGAVTALMGEGEPAESRLPFETARDNFYRAAKHGLQARITWLDGVTGSAGTLCTALLPQAELGLARLGLDGGEIGYWLGIIRERLRTGRNGAAWQRAWVARHGREMAGLTESYLENQEMGRPVHTWPV